MKSICHCAIWPGNPNVWRSHVNPRGPNVLKQSQHGESVRDALVCLPRFRTRYLRDSGLVERFNGILVNMAVEPLGCDCASRGFRYVATRSWALPGRRRRPAPTSQSRAMARSVIGTRYRCSSSAVAVIQRADSAPTRMMIRSRASPSGSGYRVRLAQLERRASRDHVVDTFDPYKVRLSG